MSENTTTNNTTTNATTNTTETQNNESNNLTVDKILNFDTLIKTTIASKMLGLVNKEITAKNVAILIGLITVQELLPVIKHNIEMLRYRKFEVFLYISNIFEYISNLINYWTGRKRIKNDDDEDNKEDLDDNSVNNKRRANLKIKNITGTILDELIKYCLENDNVDYTLDDNYDLVINRTKDNYIARRYSNILINVDDIYKINIRNQITSLGGSEYRLYASDDDDYAKTVFIGNKTTFSTLFDVFEEKVQNFFNNEFTENFFDTPTTLVSKRYYNNYETGNYIVYIVTCVYNNIIFTWKRNDIKKFFCIINFLIHQYSLPRSSVLDSIHRNRIMKLGLVNIEFSKDVLPIKNIVKLLEIKGNPYSEYETVCNNYKKKVLDKSKVNTQNLDVELRYYNDDIDKDEIIQMFNEWMDNLVSKAKLNEDNNRNILLKYITYEKVKITNTIKNPNYKQREKIIKNKNGDDVVDILDNGEPEEIEDITYEYKVIEKKVGETYKPFNTLYLREDDQNQLEKVLENFKNNADAYKEIGMTRKLCMLLHGEPGTGKTTTIKAIASYLHMNIYYVDLKNVKTNDQLNTLINQITESSINGGVIVLEDIECMTNMVLKDDYKDEFNYEHRNSHDDSEGDLTLSYFLGFLDGVLSTDNMVIIMSTNYKEKLDERIFRSMRVDYDIDFKLCDRYQINCIFNKILKRDLNEEILQQIPEDKYTPADIISHLFKLSLTKTDDYELMKDFI